jgi:hypothetical protein
MRRNLLAWAACAGLSVATPAAGAVPASETALTTLKSLVGQWTGKRASGREISVSYRLSAGDTVLVETWALAPGRESLTLYHLDGEDLVATHYCPIGNQPTLRHRDVSSAGRYDFEFRSATNLSGPAQAHQHSFSIELHGPDRITRRETYRENGVEESETIAFSRAPDPS